MREIHEGQVLETLVKENMSVEKLSARIKRHRNTIRNWFQSPTVSLDNLILVGKALRIDISNHFPRLQKELDSELSFLNGSQKILEELQAVKNLVNKEEDKSKDSLRSEVNILYAKVKDLMQIIDEKNDLIESQEQVIAQLELKLQDQNKDMKSA